MLSFEVVDKAVELSNGVVINPGDEVRVYIFISIFIYSYMNVHI
jgi:hypothetical protein